MEDPNGHGGRAGHVPGMNGPNSLQTTAMLSFCQTLEEAMDMDGSSLKLIIKIGATETLKI